MEPEAIASECPKFLENDQDFLEGIFNEIEAFKNSGKIEFGDVVRLKRIANILISVSSKPSTESDCDSARKVALAQALDVVNIIPREDDKAEPLVQIASCLRETDELMLQEVIKISEKLTSTPEKRVDISCKIAPLLPKEQCDSVIRAALGIIEDVQFRGIVIGRSHSSSEQEKRSTNLRKLTPYISRYTISSFLEIVFKLPDAAKNIAHLNSNTREYFSLCCPENRHSIALDAVQYIDDEAGKTQYLSALVPHLSQNRCFSALKLVQSIITDDLYRSEALCNLAPYLSASHLPDAFELATQAIKNSLYSVVALEALIPISQGYCFKDKTRFYDLIEFIENLCYPQLKARVLRVLSAELAVIATSSLILVKDSGLKLIVTVPGKYRKLRE